MVSLPNHPLIIDFKEVDKEDIPLVGGKGANLGEMAKADFPVPPGFILTTYSYKQFLSENKLEGRIEKILEDVDSRRPQSLQNASQEITKLFKKADFPLDVKKQTIAKYRKLGGIFKKSLVAVRSSATAEDLPQASFAGQQATLLNIQGESNLVEAVKDCWISLFTARAIFYRDQNKIPHKKVLIAVVVQQMVESQISGVAFTINPVTQEKNMMLVEAIWGLGELLVQGAVVPDRYHLSRTSLDIKSVEVSPQEVELVKSGPTNKEKKILGSRKKKQKLNEKQIKTLGKILRDIHQHYFFPQDIEWAYQKGKFYIVQTRPVTTLKSEARSTKFETNSKFKIQNLNLILKGLPASPGIASGRVIKIKSARELGKVKEGDVLVTKMTSPDFVPAMRRVSAIVTDSGGQTSHAAIVSRELGVPCVVGTKNATSFLTNGLIVTVDGSKGLVYKGGFKGGSVKGKGENLEDSSLITTYSSLKTATKVYVNLAEPEKAQEIAAKNVDGVGLLRAEFMIAEIGLHPKKAIQDGKSKDYIKKLSENLTTFCEAFYPRPVVYRATDFKTNEYKNLKGGEKFEPEEANPLMGFRGALRYINDPQVFNLELSAIKAVREQGLKNLWLMIPFVRSPHELTEVKKMVVGKGLLRGPTFQLWLMVELPINVILLPDFIKVGIDGVSIGSNDLTMLILGTDRDNETVAGSFDERSPAVLWALRHTISICKNYHVSSSICGQAPSSYPDLVENLVKWGITSVSVNPDAIDKVRENIYEAEKNLVRRKTNG